MEQEWEGQRRSGRGEAGVGGVEQEWEGKGVYVWSYGMKVQWPPAHLTHGEERLLTPSMPPPLIQVHAPSSADLIPKLVRQFHCSHTLYSHAHQLSPTHWELLSTVVSLKGLMLQMDPTTKQAVTGYISKVCVCVCACVCVRACWETMTVRDLQSHPVELSMKRK